MIGVGLIVFDRPLYFKKLLDSLEKQTDLNCDFHMFQDGVKNKFSGRICGSEHLVNKATDYFYKAKLPNKTLHKKVSNFGNAINQFEAIEYMADNYEYFLMLEEDVVLSPYYIRLIKTLIPKLNNKVFSAGLNFKRMCKLAHIKKNMDKLLISNDKIGHSIHWWGELYSTKNWKKVRKDFLDYYKFVNNVDYKLRSTEKIREFFKDNKFPIIHTSQDAGRDYALFKNKMIRLNTVVNRGISIGEYGMHFRPVTFKAAGFDNQLPYIHEQDKTLVL